MTTPAATTPPPPPSAISVDAFISQSAGSAWLGSAGDLASFVMAEQIKYQDNLINHKLGKVRLGSDARKVISDRIAFLRAELAKAPKASQEDDNVKFEFHDPRGGKTLTTWIDEDTMKVHTQWSASQNFGSKGSGDKIKANGHAIDTEIQRLEDQCQQLDSNREIEMIQLNTLIGKRGNMVQWLSNISKKQNDTEGAIINNMR